MKTTNVLAATAAALMLMTGALATAQVRVNTQVGRPENFNRVDPKKVGINNMDRNYMRAIAQSHLTEIRMGEMAQNRAAGPWAREFGRDMIREHTMALEELRLLARRKGVSLPQTPNRMQRNMLARLSRHRGAAFDREFRRMQLVGHEAAIRLNAREIRAGRDAMVRSYATKVLAPTREHHRMAVRRMTMMDNNNMGTRGSAAQPMRP